MKKLLLLPLLALVFVGVGCKTMGAGFSNPQTNSSVVTTTLTGLTSSQVVYGTATGAAGQTNLLTWDITNSRLGIGTAVPSSSLHIVSSTVTTTIIIGSPASGTNKAIQCQWNGTNYTLTSFPANSTTPTYSTSTSC